MTDRPRCCDCGRFFSGDYAWKMVYSGVLPEPDHEVFRCSRCLDAKGGFMPDPRIKPEFSCGVVRAAAALSQEEQR